MSMIAIRAADVHTPALVYVRGLRFYAEAQKWWQPVSDHDGYWTGKILAWHALDGETAALPFSTLAKVFPPPQTPREPKVKL